MASSGKRQLARRCGTVQGSLAGAQAWDGSWQHYPGITAVATMGLLRWG